MKKIILLFLLTTAILFGGAKFHDLRLLHYPQARPWLQDADTNGASANNIGILYYKIIKDNKKAIEWLEKAYKLSSGIGAGQTANSLGNIYDDLKEYKNAEKWYKIALQKKYKGAALNLGILYKKLHRYNDAIFYYKKDYKMGDMRGAHGIALIYEDTLNKKKNAMEWYKKAAKGGYTGSIKNLARYYNLEKHDKVLGGAYFIALINNGYPKQKVLTYLKTKWKLTDKEIKKAYQLQKTLDIPKHYYDPAFEDKPIKKKTGRR